jgi:hypothetical protein
VVVGADGRGFELYLWVHGYSDIHISDFYNPSLIFEPIKEISLPEDAVIVE